ncbi:MAG: thiamine-phosphate kinase [Candidatus Dormibacteria bacterium]
MTRPPDSAARRFDAGGATLTSIGETSLLSLLVGRSRASRPVALEVPSGDDASVWAPTPGHCVAVTQDCLVEGEDFRRGWISPRQLGRRAVHVAASDLAATGAWPRLCLVTLGLPAMTEVDDVIALEDGLCEAAAALGMTVAGGDVSDVASVIVIDVTVVGEVEPGRSLRRDRGRPGDVLVVTGHVGRAAAGLRLLEGEQLVASEEARAAWVAAQLAPQARISEGRAFLEAGVACAGDLSDGLLIDATRTAAASGCAAELWVEALPVDAELRAALPDEWLQAAVGGGEDFELLAGVAPSAIVALTRYWSQELAPLTIVGQLTAGVGVRLLEREGGALVEPPPSLARHYAP